MKMYCSKCGSGSSYNMTKPKFCQECGESFLGETPNRLEKEQRIEAKIVKKEAPENKIETIPKNINKLEFNAVGTLQVKGATLGQLVGTSEGVSITEERQQLPEAGLNREEFLEQFKKEAGTSRPATDG